MRVTSLFVALFAASSLAACASAPALVPDPPAIHWARTAAEHRAVYEQVFALAGRRVEVLAWVGDNIGDFPGGSQALADAGVDVHEFADFGVRRDGAPLAYPDGIVRRRLLPLPVNPIKV